MGRTGDVTETYQTRRQGRPPQGHKLSLVVAIGRLHPFTVNFISGQAQRLQQGGCSKEAEYGGRLNQVQEEVLVAATT